MRRLRKSMREAAEAEEEEEASCRVRYYSTGDGGVIVEIADCMRGLFRAK